MRLKPCSWTMILIVVANILFCEHLLCQTRQCMMSISVTTQRQFSFSVFFFLYELELEMFTVSKITASE